MHALIALGTLLLGMLGSHVVAMTSGPSASAKLLIGIWVRPRQPGPATVNDVEAAIGRRFDYALHYQRFNAVFPNADELDDKRKGRVPIVSLGCGHMDEIASGADDGTIDALASEIGTYAAPVELRYCWEMNEVYRDIGADDFVPVWRHIHDRFAQHHLRNVRWYFCPGSERQNPTSGLAYYPGDGYVDDIGVDTYDRRGEGFAQMIDAGYHMFDRISKPFIIGETGALGTQDQPSFLTASTVGLLRSRYPKIKGIVYFDAAGPHGDWSFTPQGLSSFAAFAKAARS